MVLFPEPVIMDLRLQTPWMDRPPGIILLVQVGLHLAWPCGQVNTGQEIRRALLKGRSELSAVRGPTEQDGKRGEREGTSQPIFLYPWPNGRCVRRGNVSHGARHPDSRSSWRVLKLGQDRPPTLVPPPLDVYYRVVEILDTCSVSRWVIKGPALELTLP